MTDSTDPVKQGGMFRSLRNFNARLFFLGLLVSNIGSWLQFTATSFLLYDLTGSATDLGINSALQFLPTLFLGAWAGSLSDRFDRQRLTAITQSLMAVQALALGFLDLAGVPRTRELPAVESTDPVDDEGAGDGPVVTF